MPLRRAQQNVVDFSSVICVSLHFGYLWVCEKGRGFVLDQGCPSLVGLAMSRTSASLPHAVLAPHASLARQRPISAHSLTVDRCVVYFDEQI